MKRSSNSSAAALLCSVATHLLHGNVLTAGALFLSMGSTWKPFFSLHPNNDSLRGSMHCTSSVTAEGRKSSRDSRILWCALTVFRRYHCAAEGAKCLSAPRGRQTLLGFSLFTSHKSCFVEDRPIIGSGINSCFGQRLKGRKAPNKDGLPGLMRVHRSLAVISFESEFKSNSSHNRSLVLSVG